MVTYKQELLAEAGKLMRGIDDLLHKPKQGDPDAKWALIQKIRRLEQIKPVVALLEAIEFQQKNKKETNN